MGTEINPNDKMYGTSYHKRGKDEEMSKEEFVHRISVFLEKGNLSDFSLAYNTDLAHYSQGNIDELFEYYDQNNSNGISLAELKDVKHSQLLAELAKGLTKDIPWEDVPDNPMQVNTGFSTEEKDGVLGRTKPEVGL